MTKTNQVSNQSLVQGIFNLWQLSLPSHAADALVRGVIDGSPPAQIAEKMIKSLPGDVLRKFTVIDLIPVVEFAIKKFDSFATNPETAKNEVEWNNMRLGYELKKTNFGGEISIQGSAFRPDENSDEIGVGVFEGNLQFTGSKLKASGMGCMVDLAFAGSPGWDYHLRMLCLSGEMSASLMEGMTTEGHFSALEGSVTYTDAVDEKGCTKQFTGTLALGSLGGGGGVEAKLIDPMITKVEAFASTGALGGGGEFEYRCPKPQ